MTNVTNAVSYIGGVDYTTAVGTIRQDIGRPREFGASINYKYGNRCEYDGCSGRDNAAREGSSAARDIEC